jgi:myo-inositol-1(or 4)-monophosphatase
MADLTYLLEHTIAIAKEAGAFIRKERKAFDLSQVEHKGLNDLVSYVDKQSEQLIVEKLSTLLPESDFIAEEGTMGTSGKAYTWIIDPLDGTTNFIHGIPAFAVSIGLKHHEEIVLGVVYEINLDECFYAIKGGGAWCNGNPVKVSQAADLSAALIGTGFPYSAMGKIDDYLAALKSLMSKTHGIRRIGSAATDLCYVACGRFDGFFEYNLQPYDVAAGLLIVQEAGGEVSDFNNGKDFLFGKKIIASNGLIHTAIWEEIDKFWNKES